jgi:hypothetical protein
MAHKVVINKKFIDRLSDLLMFLEMEWGKKVAEISLQRWIFALIPYSNTHT